jgi:hypothetical protein
MLPSLFTAFNMGLRRDLAMSNRLLVAHLWQIMPYFSWSRLKTWHFIRESEQKLMPLAVVTPSIVSKN